MCIASTVQEVRNSFARIRERKRQQSRELYAWCKERGICARCHSEPALPGQVYCWRCKLDDKDRKSFDYEKRKAKGLCVLCGKKNDNGLVTCDSCNAVHAARKKRTYEKRRSNKQCTICRKKLEKEYSYVTCEWCRAKERERKQAA